MSFRAMSLPRLSGDDVLQGDVPSEVDDVESGDLQHDGDDVLSDGVDVTLDGADHELSESLSGGGTGLLDLGGQDVDTGVHRVGGSHDVGQVQLLGLEELTDLLDTGGESLVDDGHQVQFLVDGLLGRGLGAFHIVFQHCLFRFRVYIFL